MHLGDSNSLSSPFVINKVKKCREIKLKKKKTHQPLDIILTKTKLYIYINICKMAN